MATLLNKAMVRRFLLDYAARTRHHKFTRVGQEVYPFLEERMRDGMRTLVNMQPSAGKTIRP